MSRPHHRAAGAPQIADGKDKASRDWPATRVPSRCDEVDRAWELRRELGRELKARRRAAGLSQRQLASRTIGYSTVRKPAAPATPEAPTR